MRAYSMNKLYNHIGISKQAVSQYGKRQHIHDDSIVELIKKVDDYRKDHPGIGLEKLYYTLMPKAIGRDRFIETFKALGYQIRRKKNYKRTTISGDKYYPNLINGLKVTGPNQVWQSDITYVRIKESHYYVIFIIDVYTKKIVGCKVSKHMRASANLKALKEAITSNGAPKIHHSDRGSQYTSNAYTKLLKSHGCKISMGLIAQDNAYAERINRTIKEEYLEYWKPRSFYTLRKQVNKAKNHYNNNRIHNHIKRYTPNCYIDLWNKTPEEMKPVMVIYDNKNN